MARPNRSEVISPDESCIVHVISRMVRRCFLLGDDPLTGKNYDYRKEWIENLLQHQAKHFGIDLLCFGLLLNMSVEDYLALLDWTARQPVAGKRGTTPANAPAILERLGLEPDVWCELVRDFPSFPAVLESVQALPLELSLLPPPLKVLCPRSPVPPMSPFLPLRATASSTR